MCKIILFFFVLTVHHTYVRSNIPYYDEYNDYMVPYGYEDDCDDVEVSYLNEQQAKNIYDFLRKFSTSTPPGIPYSTRKDTEIITEEVTTTPVYRNTERNTEEVTTNSINRNTERIMEEVTTAPTETTTITKSEAETTTVTEANIDEVEGPIEDVNVIIEKAEVTTSLPASSEKPSESRPDQKEKMDSNEYDNDYERDSEEDLISSKKKSEKIQESTVSPLDDENNSKPKNIHNWFRF